MTRKTKIIATIGPVSKSVETFKAMAPFVDIVRLNFSWGTHEEMAEMIAMVRGVSREQNRDIAILQDLSGPREQTEDGHQLDMNAQKVITEKDLKDLDFGIAEKVDFVALSYVKNASDIRELREIIKSKGSDISIVAKIERREAVADIENIIDASDAIMIARGDLGEAYPIEEVPFVQKSLLNKCNAKDRFVIVATEMLTSMISSPRPTRAEVTDVLYAVSNGADAVMLSNETAVGKYPVEAVTILDRLLMFNEKSGVK